MTDTVIERNAIVDHAILDKRIRIGSGSQVGWDGDHVQPDRPDSEKLLTVIGKNSTIPDGVRLGRRVVVAADLDLDPGESAAVPDGAHVGGVGE